nr:DUF6044 family protein [Weizmannia acidilactici]
MVLGRNQGKGLEFPLFCRYSLHVRHFLAVEYRLVYSFLFAAVPNSRDEYIHARLSFWHSVRLSFKNYVLGHTHVLTVHGFIILPFTLLAFWIVLKNKLWKRESTFVSLFILNFLLSVWYEFWFYKGWLPLTEKVHFLNTFNFARFHFFRPLVIYVLFGLSLKILVQHWGFWKKTAAAFIAGQIIILFISNDELVYHSKPTPNQFYAETLFQKIDDYIGRPKASYRVASIGLHPAIAQYNGFYTLDSYNNFYPLSYKHKFRNIIARELEKNRAIKQYFDEWSGRCYMFTDELGKHYMFQKNSGEKLSHLQLDTTAFKKMGGEFIFSAVPIEMPAENRLQFLRAFSDKDTVWKIYVYKAM